MTDKKKIGRPTKSPDGASTVVLAMRVRPEFYELLRASAASNDRSISSEAEQWLLAHKKPDDVAARLARIEALLINSALRAEMAPKGDHPIAGVSFADMAKVIMSTGAPDVADDHPGACN